MNDYRIIIIHHRTIYNICLRHFRNSTSVIAAVQAHAYMLTLEISVYQYLFIDNISILIRVYR